MSKSKSSPIQKELSRVRSLKRAAESEVLFLRSEMEEGNIHLRVNEDKKFRQKVAEAIVKMANPSWSWEYQGGYYADPVEGKVYFKESQAPWNPWSEEVNFRVVSVWELVNLDNNNFDSSIEWKYSPLYEEILEASGKDDWDEAFQWALSQPEWLEQIEEEEQNHWEESVDFALSEIKDEIVV